MTEYNSSPAAIAEWKAQRSRTAHWISNLPSPRSAPTTFHPASRAPSDSSEHSLWDWSDPEAEANGGGEASEHESVRSKPPKMVLRYRDRDVVIGPGEESEVRTRRVENPGTATGSGKGSGSGEGKEEDMRVVDEIGRAHV